MRALKWVMILTTLCIYLFAANIGTLRGEAASSLVAEQPLTVEVTLQRLYLDGEISEEQLVETIWSMEDFWSSYDDWQLVDQNKSEIVFSQEVDDISPLLKMNGYFGITEDGILSIFNGSPAGREVIQSFFQVNTEKLKSQLFDSLIEGIPVSSKEQYTEVLKRYEVYEDKEI